MVILPFVVLSFQASMSAAEFVDISRSDVRREAALSTKNLAPLLRTLRNAPPEVRTRPETQLAIHMVSAMVTPPKSRAAWLAWMQRGERLTPTLGDAAGQLKPLLVYHVARRVPTSESTAYLVGFMSDGGPAEMQMGYTQVLMREKKYPFWRLVRDGLPILNAEMREKARRTLGSAAASDSPVTARRQLGLARKWLRKDDLPGVERSWRQWMQNSG